MNEYTVAIPILYYTHDLTVPSENGKLENNLQGSAALSCFYLWFHSYTENRGWWLTSCVFWDNAIEFIVVEYLSVQTYRRKIKKNFFKCHFWFPHWTDVPHESKPILYPPTDIPLFFGESTKSGVGHCPPVVPLGCPTWCAVLTPPGVSVRVPGTLWWLPESCL